MPATVISLEATQGEALPAISEASMLWNAHGLTQRCRRYTSEKSSSMYACALDTPADWNKRK